jgi:hypothetical protein
MDTENPCVIPTNTEPAAAVVPGVEIRRHVEGYRSAIVPERLAHLVDEAREVVVRSAPPSRQQARLMLSSFARFLVDVDPLPSLSLAEVLTDATVRSWVAAQMRVETDKPRTLHQHRYRLNQMVRVMSGMPARMRLTGDPKRTRPPLSEAEVSAVEAVCRREEPAALRALVASCGAGCSGESFVGARIEVDGDGVGWVVLGEQRRRVVSRLAGLAAELDGAVVLDGDWSALRDMAATVKVPLDAFSANQTFRLTALAESGEVSLAAVMLRYRLGAQAIVAVAQHLPVVDVTADEALVGVLRG